MSKLGHKKTFKTCILGQTLNTLVGYYVLLLLLGLRHQRDLLNYRGHEDPGYQQFLHLPDGYIEVYFCQDNVAVSFLVSEP